MKLLLRRAPLALAIASLCAPAFALDLDISPDVKLSVGAQVSAGTHIRAVDPSPAVYGTLSAQRIGIQPGELGGNSGGNSLNFKKGEEISTVVKGMFDVDLNVRKTFGVFARATAWYDHALNNRSHPYGNIPNKFTSNVPLSDDGFARRAQFDGAMFTEAYAYGKFGLGADSSIDVKAGRHILNWGTAQLFPNGVNTINGVDAAASARPGALPEEQRVATGMVSAAFAFDKNWGVEGFVQYEFKPTVQNGCGTFFNVSNFAPEGCNFVSVLGGNGLTDQAALATGRFPKRAPDDLASNSGQWGLSARWTKPEIGTEIRAYYTNLHARLPMIAGVMADINGTHGTDPVSRLTAVNGLKYQMVYPEDIKMLGATVNFTPNRTTRLTLEVAHRPDMPYTYNASDLLAAFLTRAPNSSLALYRNALATAPGATFKGWENFATTNITFGVGKAFPEFLGAERWTAGAEVHYIKVGGLPDPSFVRFGRPEDFGNAQLTGGPTCVDLTRAAKTCAVEGFVTPTTWGIRGRIAANYPGLFGGFDVSPSLYLAQDVKGYAPNNAMIEGRWTIRPAVRVDMKPFYVEAAYVGTGGGTYNMTVDRDFYTLVVGAKF